MKQGECGQQQIRRKAYSLTWAYQEHLEKCPSLPQTCPDDMVEKRTQCKLFVNESLRFVLQGIHTKNIEGEEDFNDAQNYE